ncbi:helix-turn-helix transcriptional regulator [Chitinophaga pollutisoli]|uniref:Helix-turn-helix transcriptional regulator n=1 Tax=Chitinophaga pollutisoli TaxID=3133966 RepID=A0ABZ2YMQ3_9BACT
MANGNQHIERKAIGQNIRKIRQSAGLSLRKLAALCRVDHADISKIERADVDPQLSTLLELAQALRVHPVTFFHIHPADNNGNNTSHPIHGKRVH